MTADPVVLMTRIGDSVRLVPVAPGEHGAWMERELASMAEGYLGLRIADPSGRQEAVRRLGQLWEDCAEPPPVGTRLWITADGARVGTLAVYPGGAYTHLASLYVDVVARGRGVAERALAIAQDAAVLSGRRGISLETHWTWYRPAAWYMRLGFLVLHWKDTLRLVRGPGQPDVRVEILGDVAELRHGGRLLVEARRERDRLGWTQLAEPPYDAAPVATFALRLALAGFPLVRSRRAWDESRDEMDVGGPEALARRVVTWEALARRDQHVVLAPRLPGVPYRTWGELCDPPSRAVLRRRLRERFASFDVHTTRVLGGPEVELVGPAEAPVAALAVLAMESLPLYRLPASVTEVLVAWAGHAGIEVWRGRGPWALVSDSTVAGIAVDVNALYRDLDLDPL